MTTTKLDIRSGIRWGTLLNRQAELQRLGNLPTPTKHQLELARITEVGELAQVIKPTWAWWRKPGDRAVVDHELLLDEGADVLHFCLLLDVVGSITSDIDEALTPWHHTAQGTTELMTELVSPYPSGYHLARTLCTVLGEFGHSAEALVAAYYRKTEVNLERWRAVAQAGGEG